VGWLRRNSASLFCLIAMTLGVLAARTRSQGAESPDSKPPALKLLFLGDQGHHQPKKRFDQIRPVLARRAIDVKYTEDVSALNDKTLSGYDGLVIYANITRISPEQEQALLDYVASGKGFIPIHCASYCFLNSPKYIELVGAQFRRHDTGTFRTKIVAADHPIMRGFGGFESWDETYEHAKHNERNRTVLSVRGEEPWTWVRTHGKGRVFYTAWGHDERTWGHRGFQNLLERGIRWACGGDPSVVPAYSADREFVAPQMTKLADDLPKFRYTDVGPKIPNYTPSRQWGTQGKPLREMQQPLPPDQSLRHYVTPVDFQLKLYAAEGQLGGKPIAMNWDQRGRLWVCETVDYPNNLQRRGGGHDRIRICEDTDGDGTADRFTLFAENLSIPTAIAFYRGGAIVQNGIETLFLKDTDGDGRADVRKVLISGWTLGDTHGGVSNFRYGLDNWIWAMQGYNNSSPVINGQGQQGFRMGFFRFRLDDADPPRVKELEFIRSTDNNTWGLGLSEEGLVFGSTANHNPSVYMPIANRYYEQVRGWSPKGLGTIADTFLFQPITDKVRQVDQHGGYTAGAGHALYTAGAYPAQWRNRTAFVCGPTGHLVGTFVLKRDGADFHSTSPCNLVASDDEWAAPILAEVGPDGHVWVLDWYNYIVQHNPTPRGFQTGRGNAYESDLRDKKHGRVYRVVYTKAPQAAVTPPKLDPADVDSLLAALGHSNMTWRLHAQRLLVERGQQDVVPKLSELIADRTTDEIGLNVAAIHALATLDGLGALDGKNPQATGAAVAALAHPSAGVRRNAAQFLPRTAEATKSLLDSGVLEDSDAQVRLAALLALAEMPADDTAGEAIVKALHDETILRDRWIGDALTAAAAAHDVAYLRHIAEMKGPPARVADITAIVTEHFARGEPTDEAMRSVLVALAGADRDVAGAILTGLTKGWPRGKKVSLDDKAQATLVAALPRLDPGAQGQLLKLASAWGVEGFDAQLKQIAEAFLKTLRDEKAADADRIAAAGQYIALRADSAEAAGELLGSITLRTPPAVAEGTIAALSASRAADTGPMLAKQAASFTPQVRAAALRILLGRPEWTLALLIAIENRQIALGDLALDQRQALASHPDSTIRARAEKLLAQTGGLPDPDRQKVVESLHPLTEKTGDVARGKEVFLKQCSICHMHGGEGKRIGPDLTGMAVHPKDELLVHILDPSRSVEGNFRAYTVVTVDGQLLSGMLASESKTSLELVDNQGKQHVVLRDDIDELVASRKSIMPEGFEKQVPPEQIVDLLEFLTAKGKYVPLPLGKVATAVSTKGLFHEGDNGPDRMIFADWGPKTFEDVPFQLVDPRGKTTPNIVLLNGPQGTIPPSMPKSVRLPCNTPAAAIHLLGGVSGWGYPASGAKSVSMIVRLHYADGKTEDHPLQNAVHLADYIRRVDVPESKFAFALGGQQLRYLSVRPKRREPIATIELVKGDDRSAPIVMAVTVETPDAAK